MKKRNNEVYKDNNHWPVLTRPRVAGFNLPGDTTTEGLGAGSRPEIGAAAAEEALDLVSRSVRHRHDAGQPWHYGLLHHQREVERALPLAPKTRVQGEVGLAIDVERVVHTRPDAKVYYVSVVGGSVTERELPAEMIA